MKLQIELFNKCLHLFLRCVHNWNINAFVEGFLLSQQSWLHLTKGASANTSTLWRYWVSFHPSPYLLLPGVRTRHSLNIMPVVSMSQKWEIYEIHFPLTSVIKCRRHCTPFTLLCTCYSTIGTCGQETIPSLLVWQLCCDKIVMK